MGAPMSPLSLKTKIIAGAGVVIVLAVCGWCIRRDGIKLGQVEQKIVASAERVKNIETAVATADQETKVETKKLVTKNADYRSARSKVEVKGDSVIADGQRLEMPSVALALTKADTLSNQVMPTVEKQARSDTLQHALVGALNDHVDLIQQEKRPRFGTKTGIAIGVVGTIAVVYIGVRIIQALGHK
jgi:hypothetical protein